MKRAQVSMEYLFIVGFAFVLLIPVIILYFTQSAGIEDEVIGAQAQKVVDELVAAIDTVHYLGPPSKQTLKLRFPKRVLDVTIQDQTIIFTMQGPGGTYDLASSAATNITGEIGTFSGVHIITVEALDDSVSVTEN